MFVNWLKNNNVSDYSFDTRLFEKASNRAFWDGVMTDAHIKTAEEYLGYEWPLIRASQYMDFQKNGDRLSQETPHFARRYTLLKLVVGELAEYKGRFLPDIVDGIFAICEESYWGLSAHSQVTRKTELLPCASDPYIDLFAGETAELLSVIYHIFYDELYKFCPPIIERIEYEMERRIFKPYINRADFWWMGYTPKKVNNWTPWILSNVLTAFVCLDVKKTERDYAITKSFKEMQTYYDTIPADGGCDEGSHYWTVAAAKVLAYLDVLYITSGGKINLFSDKKLGEMALYELRVHIGGTRFVNFADGLASIKTTNLDYPLYGFGIRTGKPEMCALAKALKNAQTRNGSAPAVRGSKIKEVLFSIIYAKDIDAQGEYVPQKSHVLPDLQNAFLREGDWYLGAKGGNNAEMHNHNDVGSFVAYFENEPVLVDPGVGVYTRDTFSDRRYTIPSMQSAYHNLPLINGTMQKNGAQYKADKFEVIGNTVRISFAKAYDTDITKLERTLNITDGGITVSDNTDAKELAEHFMTPLDVKITDKGAVLGGKFLLVANGEISTDYLDFDNDKKFLEAWGCDGLTRIKFKINSSNAKIELRKL